MELTPNPTHPAAPPKSSSQAHRPPATLLVKFFRLAGAFACLGLSLNVLISMARGSYTDAWAMLPFLALGLLLACAVWVCREEFLETFRSGRLRVMLNGLAQTTLALLVLACLLYLFGHRYHTRLDVTVNRINQLSGETLMTLASLQESAEPVEAVYLQSVDPAPEDPLKGRTEYLRTRGQELLQSYQAQADAVARGKFSFNTLRVMEQPSELAELAARTGIPSFHQDAAEGECVVFLRGAHAKLVQQHEMFAPAQSDPSGRPRDVFQGERIFTAAIRALLNPHPKTLYFTTNHSERSGKDLQGFRDMLKKQNFVLQDLDLSVAGEVPADATAVVVCGPREAFSAQEVAGMRAYLERGGHALFFFDPVLPSLASMARKEAGLADLLAEYGLRVRQNLLTRSFRPTFGGEPALRPQVHGLPSASESVLLRALRDERTPVLFAQPCVVQVDRPVKEKYRPEVLLESGPYKTTDFINWAGPVNQSKHQPEAGPESLPGPVPLIAFSRVPVPASDKKAGEGARLLVVADSEMAIDQFYEANAANRVFLWSCAHWIMGDDELASEIPPKEVERREAKFDANQGRVLMVALILGLPLALIFAGVVVWSLRKT